MSGVSYPPASRRTRCRSRPWHAGPAAPRRCDAAAPPGTRDCVTPAASAPDAPRRAAGGSGAAPPANRQRRFGHLRHCRPSRRGPHPSAGPTPQAGSASPSTRRPFAADPAAARAKTLPPPSWAAKGRRVRGISRGWRFFTGPIASRLVTAPPPQPVGCGDVDARVGARADFEASTVPQLVGCGDLVVERPAAVNGLASTVPQLVGCGDAERRPASRRPAARFNGAAAGWLRRSRRPPTGGPSDARASTVPQLVGCGDRPTPSPPPPRPKASTVPQLVGCGDR